MLTEETNIYLWKVLRILFIWRRVYIWWVFVFMASNFNFKFSFDSLYVFFLENISGEDAWVIVNAGQINIIWTVITGPIMNART